MIPLHDTLPARHPPRAVWGLIGANALVFALELSLSPDDLAGLFATFAAVPARIAGPGDAPPIWTLVTCMFLHGGWLHLLGNLWMLWIFGDNVEDRMGPGRFVAFYLLCGLLASTTEVAANPAASESILGASGAIAGVMGAYLAMFPRARIVMLVPLLFWPLYIAVSAFGFLVYWFVLQVISGSLDAGTGGVAYAAHAGGFIAGLLLHRAFLRHEYRAHVPGEDGLEATWLRRHA